MDKLKKRWAHDGQSTKKSKYHPCKKIGILEKKINSFYNGTE